MVRVGFPKFDKDRPQSLYYLFLRIGLSDTDLFPFSFTSLNYNRFTIFTSVSIPYQWEMIAHISAEHMVQQIEFHLIKMWQERKILAILIEIPPNWPPW